jgi:hypothetical protein
LLTLHHFDSLHFGLPLDHGGAVAFLAALTPAIKRIVERLQRVLQVAGSNPAAPTNKINDLAENLCAETFATDHRGAPGDDRFAVEIIFPFGPARYEPGQIASPAAPPGRCEPRSCHPRSCCPL